MHSSLPVNPDITQVEVLNCIILKHLLESNLSVKKALLTIYFLFADTESADLNIYSLGGRNLCPWNCMISGFAQNNHG